MKFFTTALATLICSTSLAEAQLSPLQNAANNHCKDIQVGTAIKLRYALNKEFRRGNTLLEVTVDGVADLVCSVEGISQFLEKYDELNQYADELEFTYLSEDL